MYFLYLDALGDHFVHSMECSATLGVADLLFADWDGFHPLICSQHQVYKCATAGQQSKATSWRFESWVFRSDFGCNRLSKCKDTKVMKHSTPNIMDFVKHFHSTPPSFGPNWDMHTFQMPSMCGKKKQPPCGVAGPACSWLRGRWATRMGPTARATAAAFCPSLSVEKDPHFLLGRQPRKQRNGTELEDIWRFVVLLGKIRNKCEKIIEKSSCLKMVTVWHPPYLSIAWSQTPRKLLHACTSNSLSKAQTSRRDRGLN